MQPIIGSNVYVAFSWVTLWACSMSLNGFLILNLCQWNTPIASVVTQPANKAFHRPIVPSLEWTPVLSRSELMQNAIENAVQEMCSFRSLMSNWRRLHPNWEIGYTATTEEASSWAAHWCVWKGNEQSMLMYTKKCGCTSSWTCYMAVH